MDLKKLIFFFTIVLLLPMAVLGQKNKKDNSRPGNSTRNIEVQQQQKYTKAMKKKDSAKRGRMALAGENTYVDKARELKAKEMKNAHKPQFSDPLYFGHKRKPKKRPVGKRKLCKECGMVH